CIPHSAQAAEIVALATALENTPVDNRVVIFTDSERVLRIVVERTPQWKKRGTRSADKPTAHAGKLSYL
ncbi:hypothetical protein G0U57_004473, partial [Chelydra serpentina]